jgi:hypothetical protein
MGTNHKAQLSKTIRSLADFHSHLATLPHYLFRPRDKGNMTCICQASHNLPDVFYFEAAPGISYSLGKRLGVENKAGGGIVAWWCRCRVAS